MIAFMLSANSLTKSIPRHVVDHQCILREPIPTSDFSCEEINRKKVSSNPWFHTQDTWTATAFKLTSRKQELEH